MSLQNFTKWSFRSRLLCSIASLWRLLLLSNINTLIHLSGCITMKRISHIHRVIFLVLNWSPTHHNKSADLDSCSKMRLCAEDKDQYQPVARIFMVKLDAIYNEVARTKEARPTIISRKVGMKLSKLQYVVMCKVSASLFGWCWWRWWLGTHDAGGRESSGQIPSRVHNSLRRRRIRIDHVQEEVVEENSHDLV